MKHEQTRRRISAPCAHTRFGLFMVVVVVVVFACGGGAHLPNSRDMGRKAMMPRTWRGRSEVRTREKVPGCSTLVARRRVHMGSCLVL